MAKIWECDFTTFSGVSGVALENVGTQHLVSGTNINKVNPMATMSFRPGVSFIRNTTTAQNFNLTTSNATNALLRGSWTRRSFVLWVYNPQLFTNSSFWDSANASNVVLWGFQTGAGANDAGVFATGGSSSTMKVFMAQAQQADLGNFTGWKNVVITVDRSIGQTKTYADGVLVATTSNLPPSSTTSSSPPGTDETIGNKNTSSQGTFQIGYFATYDTVLTPAEITALYTTFLVDNAAGNTPFQTVSGTVFGVNGAAVSGATVYLLHEDSGTIQDKKTSSASGTYTLNIPIVGNYTVVATSSPNQGSRSYPMIVSSGGGVSFP